MLKSICSDLGDVQFCSSVACFYPLKGLMYLTERVNIFNIFSVKFQTQSTAAPILDSDLSYFFLYRCFTINGNR